jgi:hypothetical protein
MSRKALITLWRMWKRVLDNAGSIFQSERIFFPARRLPILLTTYVLILPRFVPYLRTVYFIFLHFVFLLPVMFFPLSFILSYFFTFPLSNFSPTHRRRVAPPPSLVGGGGRSFENIDLPGKTLRKKLKRVCPPINRLRCYLFSMPLKNLKAKI